MPALLLVLLCASNGHAAGHHEITVISVGPAYVEKGTHDVSYRLPGGPQGPLPQPVVFIGVQPRAAAGTAPLLPSDETSEPEANLKSVPAVLRFTVAGNEMPPWELHPYPTAYVINLDAVTNNPEFDDGRLALQIGADTTADAVKLKMFGMPDPLLLDSSTSGPLLELARAAADPEVKDYLTAFATEIAGDKEAARSEYLKLRSAKNARVGRFARRGLRMLSYEFRRYPLSGNFMEHYRWGLYLQQCGLYSAAFTEFEECRIIFPWHAESQFRAGESLDRLAGSIFKVLDYVDRTAEAGAIPNPAQWHVLVVILKSRKGRTLSSAEIRQIKDRWLIAEETVWGTCGGRARIVSSFIEVQDSSRQAYTVYPGGLYAPTDDIIEQRGWFDGVISVLPRLPDDGDARGRTVGGDIGPQGAALSGLFDDSRWQDYLAAWYDQITYAAELAELPAGYPLADQALGCGHQPAAHRGDAYRAALRYYFTPAMLRRLKITDVPVPGSAVQLWEIKGPYPIEDAAPETGPPARHVMDPLPASSAARTIRIASPEDFINLAELFPDAGWARAQAASWVYSPRDQEVRMWFGQNDGLAVWVNGRCVHRGLHYAAGKHQDRNLVDTIASYARLKKGWNEVRVVVESWPAPRDKGWGFSVRFCTPDNEPLPGLACLNRRPDRDLAPRSAPPPAGPYYSWPSVKFDYHQDLPALSAADLERITGVQGLRISGAVDQADGFAAFQEPGRTASPTYRPVSSPLRPGRDRDVVLNNVLDWAREACAAFRYQKDGRDRDLLIIKPESIEAYLTLLTEPASAVGGFDGRPPSDRILGYVLIPAGRSSRALLVIDALLSDPNEPEKPAWPLDEEDLLSPLGQIIPNSTFESVGPQAG